MSEGLLTRDDFRNGVFARDGHKCVVCGEPAQDAHHIIERRLWPDGGYYLDNGASLCGTHHIDAERTVLSCDSIREAAGIARTILPPHLYDDQPYDKWGNPILPNGRRLKGELADDESVKKVTEGYIDFTHLVKYPRTYHLPWSEGLTKDDRQLESVEHFVGKEVVVTKKMDGENTTMYRDFIHARSPSGGNHPTRDWVKALWGQISYEIPEGWRFCGENLYAEHSIHYKGLPSYFLLFSIWNDKNICLSWDETVMWGDILGLWTEKDTLLWRGTWDEEAIKALRVDSTKDEGYIVRTVGEFHYKDFRRNVAKYVRKNHVHTHGHWMKQVPVPNELDPKWREMPEVNRDGSGSVPLGGELVTDYRGKHKTRL